MHGDLAAIIELAIHQADFSGFPRAVHRGRPHTGTHPQEWSPSTTVSLSEDAWQRLALLTQESGLPRNTVLNQALMLYLASVDPQQPKRYGLFQTMLVGAASAAR